MDDLLVVYDFCVRNHPERRVRQITHNYHNNEVLTLSFVAEWPRLSLCTVMPLLLLLLLLSPVAIRPL
jgi:hypothetical protein